MKIKNSNQGFTLLELLVVVLIIGILAAIALPQYKKAVEKARMTEAITMVEKIAQAQQRYFLVNNTYTRDINALDLDIPGQNVNYVYTVPGKQTTHFLFTASNNANYSHSKIALVTKIPQSTKYTLSLDSQGKRYCFIYSNATDYEKKLCSEWANGNVTVY